MDPQGYSFVKSAIKIIQFAILCIVAVYLFDRLIDIDWLLEKIYPQNEVDENDDHYQRVNWDEEQPQIANPVNDQQGA